MITLPAIGVSLLTLASPVAASSYDHLKPSLFTIEVHSSQAAKSELGSGYLVAADGLVATNYHVVGSYINEPDRYSIRVRNGEVERPAQLVAFDLVNDLALLKVSGLAGRPLVLAERLPPTGAPIVAFGNPEALGLSLVHGVFNGFPEHGIVDRMLLSMPINSGMSGGPILDTSGRVVGTNVSTYVGSDSLSFGVPVAKLKTLLACAPVDLTKPALLDETRRQLEAFERVGVARLRDGFDRARSRPEITIGEARVRRFPALFQCWDNSRVDKKDGLTRSWLSCHLDFAPRIEGLGPVGSVQIILEHVRSAGRSYGFHAGLTQAAVAWNKVGAVPPGDDERFPPQCVAGRFAASQSVWKANTCATSYVKYPGLVDYELIALSASETHSAVLVVVRMAGFQREGFETVIRNVFDGIAPVVAR